MLGINGYELIILVVLELVFLGPELLPQYAQTLAEWVRKARGMAEDAKKQFKDETGTDFDDVDWRRYDPRQYDPRRIIREALADDFEETRRAVDEVRDAARLERPKRGGAARGASTARSAGTAGAARRSGAATDPREVFGSSSTTSSGAVAAGMAGAAATGPVNDSAAEREAVTEPAEPAPEPEPEPAPFDRDAT